MQITSYERDDNTIIAVEGRLDTLTSGDLRSWLETHFTPPAGKAVLDCSSVDYISSAGLRIILNMIKQMKKHKFAFSIYCPHEHIREILTISGFTILVQVHKTMEDCL